ncbi:hypothetical protein FF1_002363 [Malus domestica]
MARDSETSTNGNSNVQRLGSARSTRLNTMMSGATLPPHGTIVATTTVATLGKTHGAKATSQAVPLQPSRAQALAELARPAQAQRVAKLSLSFAPTCATHQAAHSSGLACFRGLLSNPNWSKISSTIMASNFWAYD